MAAGTNLAPFNSTRLPLRARRGRRQLEPATFSPTQTEWPAGFVWRGRLPAARRLRGPAAARQSGATFSTRSRDLETE